MKEDRRSFLKKAGLLLGGAVASVVRPASSMETTIDRPKDSGSSSATTPPPQVLSDHYFTGGNVKTFFYIDGRKKIIHTSIDDVRLLLSDI